MCCGFCVIFKGKPSPSFGPSHCSTSAVTATVETLRVSFSLNDVGASSHTSWDNPHVAFARSNSTFSRYEYVLAVVVLPAHIIMVTVHRFEPSFEFWDLSRTPNRINHRVHHQFAIFSRVVLGPRNRFRVITEVV